MESWAVVRRNRRLYFSGPSRTRVHLSSRRKIDICPLLEDLNAVQFPKKYLRGIKQVQFTLMGKKLYGFYLGGNIWVDTSRKRLRRTILEIFVHEVAHHVHFEIEQNALKGLARESNKRGHFIHRYVKDDEEEYFARGFERFYSLDTRKRESLRRHNPKLYRRISRLHARYAR